MRQSGNIGPVEPGQAFGSIVPLADSNAAVLPYVRSMTNRSGLIRGALSEMLAPLVAAEGGQVYFEEVGDEEVSLHWAGRYAGSPAAGLLHEEVAVPLVQQVAPGTLVKWSSGRLVPAKAELIEPAKTRVEGSE
jgi:hypothetical protein